MSSFSRLSSIGLTNRDSEYYGAIASAQPRDMSFSFCCGETYRNTAIDNCRTCKRYLFWQSAKEDTFLQRQKTYFDKIKREGNRK